MNGYIHTNSQVDRTGEFIEYVKLAQSKSRLTQNSASAVRKNSRVASQRSQFTSEVSGVAQSLTSTFAKLENLTYLTRHQNLFDENAYEIQQLTVIIKEDIEGLNQKLTMVQSRYQQNAGRQSNDHSNAIMTALRTHLAKASDRFKGVLEQRTRVLKSQAARRSLFQPQSLLINANSSQLKLSTSILLEDENKSSSLETTSEAGPLLQTRMHRQLEMVDQTEAFLASRADTMKNIEHTIVELGEIFQNLAMLVHQQDEHVQRLDTNLELTTSSIQAGHDELMKYMRSISSNRWLMLKVFGVLFFFFIIFAGVFL